MIEGYPDGHARGRRAHRVLIRPFTLDTGPAPREYVPMEKRG